MPEPAKKIFPLGDHILYGTSDEIGTMQSVTEVLKREYPTGKIHSDSDMERGFIRAEVISYGDLVKCGSLPKARKKELLRTAGKSYVVQDGDVITFLFNV